MRVIHFDRSQEIPIVDALIIGRSKYEELGLFLTRAVELLRFIQA